MQFPAKFSQSTRKFTLDRSISFPATETANSRN